MRRVLLFLVLGSLAVTLWAQDVESKKGGGLQAPPPPATQKEGPTWQPLIKTYGTAAVSYYRISAAEFTPLSLKLDAPYSDEFYQWAPAGAIFRRFSSVPDGFFVATPHLPSGATIVSMEFDGCNDNATQELSAHIYDCNSQGDCTATTPVDISVAPNAGCTSALTTTVGFQVDNHLKQQVVRVVTAAGDITTRFAGVTLGYQLNVSPPPGSPTFNDVPISDFGFQYIEALVASGITAGCGTPGGPNFCPDSVVTRRQMAIFLAKALGLQWP